MSLLPLRPLGFGEIVDGALQLYRRNFALYYLAALAAAAPSHLLVLATETDPAPLPPGDAALSSSLPEMGAAVAGLLAALAIDSVGAVAVCAAMTERIAGRPATVGGSYLTALRRLPSVWGAISLAGILGLACLGALAMAVLGATALASQLAGAVGMFVAGAAGVALFAAAATFLLGAFFGILPAAVSEGRGPLGALARSLGLFRAGWPRVTGVMAVALIVASVPTVAILALTGFEDIFVSPEAMERIGSEGAWLAGVLGPAFGALTLPFTVGCAMVLFHDRRVRAEGYDLEARARAMDGD